MRNLILLFVITLLGINLNAQESKNMNLLANVTVGEESNDIWGYVDDNGIEYAILGSRATTRIYSLEDPSNPIERAAISGAAGIWRDIKVWEDHIYVVADQGADGMLIIDMSGAPENITHTFWQPILQVEANDGSGFIDYELQRCHNLYIDSLGFAYLAGCNGDPMQLTSRGVIILDLKLDKKNPVYVGTEQNTYAHDVYVRDDIMYTSDLTQGLNIYDVSDKSNPIHLAQQTTSFNFCHNAWSSYDGNYVFTTDERANANMDAYDISDKDNIVRTDLFKPLKNAGQGVIPHNAHYKDGLLYVSWYTDGIRIIDGNKPDNLVEVGYYETWVGAPGNYNGCWGAYPFLPSGIILASDIQTGLYVLGDTAPRAAYLEGRITSEINGLAINGADVSIEAAQLNEGASDPQGNYKTGLADAGTYMVTYSHPSYKSKTVEVTLINGEVTTQDVQLTQVLLNGTTLKKLDGTALGNVSIQIVNQETGDLLNTTTDADGQFSIGLKEGTVYDIYAAVWGYRHQIIEAYEFQEGGTVTMELDEGYQDDFFADMNWVSEGDASSGFWERGIPLGTQGNGFIASPFGDVEGDIGSFAFVTGNNGTNWANDDIDGGEVILTSPMMDFTGSDKATISYNRWFFNEGGQGSTPNDSLTISLTNGQETIQLEVVKGFTEVWSDSIKMEIFPDNIPFTTTMQVVLRAGDYDEGHIVEAALDQFSVELQEASSTEELDSSIAFQIAPNPFSNSVQINLRKELPGVSKVILTDISGRILMQNSIYSNDPLTLNTETLQAGIYFIQIANNGKVSNTQKVIKH